MILRLEPGRRISPAVRRRMANVVPRQSKAAANIPLWTFSIERISGRGRRISAANARETHGLTVTDCRATFPTFRDKRTTPRAITGMIKVTWSGGEITSVESVDAMAMGDE